MARLPLPARQRRWLPCTSTRSKKQATADLSRRADRRGAGQVRVTRVEMVGAADANATVLSTGQPATLTFHLTRVLPRMSCIFTIYDQRGEAIASFNSNQRGQNDAREARMDARCVCQMNELPLLPGRVPAERCHRDGRRAAGSRRGGGRLRCGKRAGRRPSADGRRVAMEASTSSTTGSCQRTGLSACEFSSTASSTRSPTWATSRCCKWPCPDCGAGARRPRLRPSWTPLSDWHGIALACGRSRGAGTDAWLRENRTPVGSRLYNRAPAVAAEPLEKGGTGSASSVAGAESPVHPGRA